MTGALSIAVLLSLPLLSLPLALTRVSYYVKPTLETPCHHEDCLTLSEYASEASRYFNSGNLALVFLSGEHTLNSSIAFQLLESLFLQGNLSSFPNITSKIVCIEASAFAFIDITKVEVKGLAFEFCGIKLNSIDSSSISYSLDTLDVTVNTVPAIFALSIVNFSLTSCHMAHNHLPILLNKSSVYLRDMTFKGNKGWLGGAIAAHNSTIVFLGQNLFQGNEAAVSGGIFADSSELTIRGPAPFINNTALNRGGGICAIDSTINFNMDMYGRSKRPVRLISPCDEFSEFSIFLRNSAIYGGGISMLRSIMRHAGGALVFTGNLAGEDGGAISSSGSSSIRLDGCVTFENNSLSSFYGQGGAVALFSSAWHSTTIIAFVSNFASYGGAVYSKKSNLVFSVPVYDIGTPASALEKKYRLMLIEGRIHSTFNNNTAIEGGAMLINNCTVEFIGNSNFDHNEASRGGGGISATHSKIEFDGNGVFPGDSALEKVGEKNTEPTEAYYKGCIIFTGNVAETHGGGIKIAFSTLTLSGETKLLGNRAQDSGGGMYLWKSTLHISALLKMGRYYNTTMRHYWGMLVK